MVDGHLGSTLRTHGLDRRLRRSDELHTCSPAFVHESCVLRQESEARVAREKKKNITGMNSKLLREGGRGHGGDESPVSRMDGLAPCLLGDLQDSIRAKVAVRCEGSSDAVGLVCHLCMHRIFVSVTTRSREQGKAEMRRMNE